MTHVKQTFDYEEQERLAGLLEQMQQINRKLEDTIQTFERCSALMETVLQTRAIICPIDKGGKQ